MIDVKNILNKAQAIVEVSIKDTLKEQGHYLTGALERSISGDVNSNNLDGSAFDYALKLDRGVPASKIVINSQTLADMTRYVELRMGLKGKQATKAAYNILL